MNHLPLKHINDAKLDSLIKQMKEGDVALAQGKVLAAIELYWKVFKGSFAFEMIDRMIQIYKNSENHKIKQKIENKISSAITLLFSKVQDKDLRFQSIIRIKFFYDDMGIKEITRVNRLLHKHYENHKISQEILIKANPIWDDLITRIPINDTAARILARN